MNKNEKNDIRLLKTVAGEEEKRIFKIFTGELEAFTEKSGETTSYRLRGIASGTSLDAEGDRMSEKALSVMEKQIIGLTLHKDHVFKVDNTLGHFVDSKIIVSEDDDVTELWVEAELEPFDVNPDAKRVYEKIRSGTRLGFSVAGLLRDWEKLDSEDSKTRFLITDIELLSVDLVTIPAYRASQGSVVATDGNRDNTEKNIGTVYVCKQIGRILRENRIRVSNHQYDPADETDEIKDRMTVLEQKIGKLEELVKGVFENESKADPDIEMIIARINRIEAAIVNPPKSTGMMIHPDGRVNIDADEVDAFEKGGGNLMGGI